MWDEQVRNNWPGLAKEVKKICEQLDIEEASSDKSKIEWKEL